MKKDIVVCKKCVEDDVYYSKLIKAGGKYTSVFFYTLEKYRESVLEKLNI